MNRLKAPNCKRCGHVASLHVGATGCNGHASTGSLPQKGTSEYCSCEGYLGAAASPQDDLHRRLIHDITVIANICENSNPTYKTRIAQIKAITDKLKADLTANRWKMPSHSG